MKNDDSNKINAQEEPEVLQAGPLDNMEKVDPMGDRELQDYLEALSPDQQEAYRQQADQSALRLVEAFDPAHLEESISEAFKNAVIEACDLAEKLSAALPDALRGEGDALLVGAAALRASLASLSGSLSDIDKKMWEAQEKITAFCDSETFNKLSDMLPGFREWYAGLMDCEISDIPTITSPGEFIRLGDFTEEAQGGLLPFIQKEIEARRKEGADQLTAAEFFRDTDPDTGEPVESIYSRVRQRAREWANLPPLEPLGGQPQKYVMPNDAVTNSLIGRTNKKTGELEPVVNAGPFDLPFFDVRKPTEVTAFVNITLAKEFMMFSELPFEGPDYSVLFAVISLIDSGREKFTAEEVLRQIYAHTHAEDNCATTVEEVDARIMKLNNMPVEVDLSAVIERMNRDRRRNHLPKENDPLLVGEEIKESVLVLVPKEKRYVDGGTVYEYSVLYNPDGSVHEPALLTMARALGQITTVPLSMMNIRKTKNGKLLPYQPCNMSLSRSAIRDYLAKRIMVMKNELEDRQEKKKKNKREKQEHSILFETLYNHAGVSKSDKYTKKRVRDYAFECLDYWKATGLIAGYEVEKTGRGGQYRSVKIKFKNDTRSTRSV